MGSITELEDSGVVILEAPKEQSKVEGSEEPVKIEEPEKEATCNGKIEQNDSGSTIELALGTKQDKALPSPADVELDDDDDEDEDETIVERLIGLSEMFPDSLRNGVFTFSSSTLSLVKGAYSLSRQVVWIGVSTSIILFAPVMFELERYNVEEMVKQDRNRLVLGPGSAMSGPPGMAPPPIR